jgi:hypothetical protein
MNLQDQVQMTCQMRELGNLNEVADFIKTLLQPHCTSVVEDVFPVGSLMFKNIIGTNFDSTEIKDVGPITIIGAHWDAVIGSPGADDNASGMVGMIEIARQLSSELDAPPIMYVAFDGEECGYIGSSRLAHLLKDANTPVALMLCLEMIGFTGPMQKYPFKIMKYFYPATGDYLAAVGNWQTWKFLRTIKAEDKTTQLLLMPFKGKLCEEVRRSDHSSFWDLNYPAVLLTDTAYFRNPNYHLPRDTPETLNYDFLQHNCDLIVQSLLNRKGRLEFLPIGLMPATPIPQPLTTKALDKLQ